MADVIRPDGLWNDRWIKPEERMPTPNEAVLAYADCGYVKLTLVVHLAPQDGWAVHGNCGMVDGTVKMGWRAVADMRLDEDFKVIAWTPLPEMP